MKSPGMPAAEYPLLMGQFASWYAPWNLAGPRQCCQLERSAFDLHLVFSLSDWKCHVIMFPQGRVRYVIGKVDQVQASSVKMAGTGEELPADVLIVGRK